MTKLTPTVTNPVTGETHTPEPGCHIDGHWGQYGPSRVLRLADDLLQTNYFAEAEVAARTELGEDPMGMMTSELQTCEAVIEIADEAENALNEATINGRWGWEDGEFFLTANYETDTTVFHGGRDWPLADLGPVWCLWHGGSNYAAPDADTNAVRFESLLAALNAHDEAYRGKGFWNHEGEYSGDTPGVTDNCRTLVFLTDDTHGYPDFVISGVDLSEGYETEWAEDNEGEMVWTVTPA